MPAFNPLSVCTLLVLLIALAACGDGFSSVDSELKVSELSEDEAATYCEDEVAYVDSSYASILNQDVMCTAYGVEEAIETNGSAATCEQAYSACMNMPFEQEESGVSCNLDFIDRSSCDATVGQMQDCTQEEVGQIRSMANSISCSSVQNPQDFEGLDELGSACQLVADECPGLF